MSILNLKQFIPNETNVKIMGRHVIHNDTLFLSFSASYVEFTFDGARIYADIKTDLWDKDDIRGYVGVFVDGKFTHKFALDKEQQLYEIYKSADPVFYKPVVIRIVRFSETNFGKVGIVALYHDGVLTPTEKKTRKLEFIGNSITCGYGVEAENELENFRTETENPTEAYAYLTAEALDADFHLVSWSGNGILTHWIPGDRETKDELYPLMAPVYELQDVAGAEFIGIDKTTPNDFEAFAPDTVVINIGTNDDSYVRDHDERRNEFEEAFLKFLRMVIGHRKGAKIYVAYGVMTGNVKSAEISVVEKLKKEGVDITFVEFPPQLPEDGMGADYHPSKVTHKKMRDILLSYVK